MPATGRQLFPFCTWLRRTLWLALTFTLTFLSSGCCLVEALFPADPFAAQLRELSPTAVSLHEKIPYRDPTGPDACGLSCLDMVFAYEQINLPDADIARLREKAAQENGLTVNDMVALLQKAGFKTLRRQGRFEWPAVATAAAAAQPPANGAAPPPWYKDINNPLSQIHFGRPVILHLMLKPKVYHFALLVGFDEAERKFILLNPGLGPMVVPAAQLDALWAGGERVFLAYKPPDNARRAPAAPTGPAPVRSPATTLPK